MTYLLLAILCASLPIKKQSFANGLNWKIVERHSFALAWKFLEIVKSVLRNLSTLRMHMNCCNGLLCENANQLQHPWRVSLTARIWTVNRFPVQRTSKQMKALRYLWSAQGQASRSWLDTCLSLCRTQPSILDSHKTSLLIYKRNCRFRCTVQW